MSICCPDIYLYLFYLFGESWHLETILKFPVKTLVFLISLLHDLGFLYFSWDSQVEVTNLQGYNDTHQAARVQLELIS